MTSSLLFKWESLKEIGPHQLTYKMPIPGKAYEIELASGPKIRVWRADDGQTYFCHALSFGGKEAPGGPISPFSGKDVQVILENHYTLVEPESSASAGDILVWQGLDEITPHSAILVEPVAEVGKEYLAYASLLLTKNGIMPETTMTLEQLIVDYYGESYDVYRRR